MPTLEQALNSLSALANQWDFLAIAWYLYFAVFCLALFIGIRPSKRISAILLIIPLLPVSALAWRAGDLYDAILTGLSAIVLLLIAIRLPRERIHIEPSWHISMGILLIAAGWLYFPLLQGYLAVYTVPVGLISSPTLMLITALSLMMDGLESRPWALVLGAIGLFYGILGLVRLGISMDLFLIFGSLISILEVYLPKAGTPRNGLTAKTT